MTFRSIRRAVAMVGLSLGVAATPALAVTSYSDPNGARYTGAPTGDLANSGYQYEGAWKGNSGNPDYTGTVISPYYFISARHLQSALSNDFVLPGLNGQPDVTYHRVQDYTYLNTDLLVIRVDQPFPADRIAPLYTGTAQASVGKSLAAYGRGPGVGAQVRDTNGQLHGWQWGGTGNDLSWGRNTVDSVVHDNTMGDFVAMNFTSTGCTLVGGDSGGGVFINDGGVWKLAGVNFSSDGGNYSFSPNSNGTNNFSGSLFNRDGFYEYDYFGNHTWDLMTGLGPGQSWASSISGNIAFVGAFVPEPGSAAILALAAAGLLRRRR